MFPGSKGRMEKLTISNEQITKYQKAYDGRNNSSDDMLDMLALHVTSDFRKNQKRGKILRRYSGQCENVLIPAGYRCCKGIYFIPP